MRVLKLENSYENKNKRFTMHEYSFVSKQRVETVETVHNWKTLRFTLIDAS